ncbi:hypothetical protein FRC17_003141 [Serendipita sp. 399]|nr:hypothetical protein FRC17_003141 [Serendipita sp. 399]
MSAAMLPTEIWQDILSYVLFKDILPTDNANFFVNMDLFAHPCKIHTKLSYTKTNLSLVCHLWNNILQALSRSVLFVDSVSATQPTFEITHSLHRLEILNGWADHYCRRWPCRLSLRQGGRCPESSYTVHPFQVLEHNVHLTPTVDLHDLQVLRLQENYPNPSHFLSLCKRLRAISTRFSSFVMAYQPGATFTRISHLDLDLVIDSGTTYVLDLPQMEYLKVDFGLSGVWDSQNRPLAFPLKIVMPKLTTLHLEGWFDDGYKQSMDELIFSSKNSLVNLLLSLNPSFFHSGFPLERLAEFPNLSIFGWNIRNFKRALPGDLPNHLRQSNPTLSLLILGLDLYHRRDPYDFRLEYAGGCIEVFKRTGNWFSSIVIPMEWRELEDLWVQACDKFEDDDSLRAEDPLPCCWSFLDHIQRAGIRIQDCDRIDLSEGDGAGFTKKMRAYMEDEDYLDRRRKHANREQ